MARKRRITVVNDYPEFLQLVVDLLTAEGYEVVPLPKHQGAFEQILASKPDVVICDLIFESAPHGWSVIDMLFLHPDTRGIPLIVCSAATQHMREIAPSLAARGIRWIEKPFEIERLLKLLAEIDAGK